MRRVLCLFVAVGAFSGAPPAHAEVVAERLARIGPVLEPDRVTWGEESRGEVAVFSTQGGAIVERARLPAARGSRTTRQFGGLGTTLASTPSRLAFVADTTRVVERGGDHVVSEGSTALWLAPPLRSLGRPNREQTAVAAEGSALAFGEWVFLRRGMRVDVVVRDGARVRRFVAARRPAFVRRVRLAGRYVAWTLERIGASGSASRVVVADRFSGRRVLVLRTGPGSRGFFDVDLQPDGTVAVLRARRYPILAGVDVAWASPRSRRLRTVARGANQRQVELAGGRVVFETVTRDEPGTGLAVVPLAGGPVTTIRPATRERQRVGNFDFDGRRLAWAEADVPIPGDVLEGSTGRIHVVDVP